MLKEIDALLFDLDGTLVDSMWIWTEIDRQYLGRFGLVPPTDLSAQIEGRGFTETAHYFKERFGLPDAVETIKSDWNKLAWQQYTTQVWLKPGVGKLLQTARQKGLKMGIATSNSVELVEKIAEVHHLQDYFTVIRTSCDAKRGKPAPDLYLMVAEELRVRPERCLVFEDIIPGIKAGKAAGMRVCGVEDEYSAAQREEKIRLSDYYIYHYDEVLRCV